MKINFREASTKRAIVMTITGCITLYNITFGSGASDMDALIHRVEFWLGTGLTIAGMFGFLPDQPTRDPQERTRETDTYTGPARATATSPPPVESYRDNFPVIRVRNVELSSDAQHQDPGSTLRQDGGGYNG